MIFDNTDKIANLEKLLYEVYPDHKLDLSLLTQNDILGLKGELYTYKLWKSLEEKFHLKVKWTGIQSYNKKNVNEKRSVIDFKIRRKMPYLLGLKLKTLIHQKNLIRIQP